MYQENNNMGISLYNNQKNPDTKDLIIKAIILFVIALIIITITYQFNNKQKAIILIICLLSIPITVHAINILKINLTTKVTIEEKRNILEARYKGEYSNDSHFWEYAYYIKTITFETTIEEPKKYEHKFDVSDKQDKSIIAYLVKNKENPELFDLYIMSFSYIYANPDSSKVFREFLSLTTINNIEYYKTPYAENMRYMFSKVPRLEELDLSHFNTSNVTDMSYMFSQNEGSSSNSVLRKLDVSSFDTSKVTDMSYMFNDCHNVTNLDVSKFDTSKVTNMESMFQSTGIQALDLSHFNTSNVTNMKKMFSSTRIEELDLSSFDTKKVTTMDHMFHLDSYLKKLDISSFETSNVTNMEFMFASCKSLTSLDLSSFDISNATIRGMFHLAESLISLDISSFDTSNIVNMDFLFKGCKSLVSLDLSNFNTNKVESMSQMFEDCINLETIYVNNNWTVENVNESYAMFKNCSKLPNYNSSYVDKTRANTSDTGYLTLKL